MFLLANLAMFFTHNTQYSLLLLIPVQVQCDLAITRFYMCECMYTKLSWPFFFFFKYKSWLDFLCVCMCVFGIHVLKIAVERWFWEVHMVFGSLVVLHVWLHSCLCFSLLKKLFSKSLLDTWLSVELPSFVSYRNFNTSSTPGGSIEKVPVSSIASR